MKNLLTILLLVTTSISAQVTGYVDNTSTGTSGDPIEISTVNDIIYLSKTSTDWDKYFIQTADIDFGDDETAVDWDNDGSATWDAGDQEGLTPIGNINVVFIGYYDGNNHTINELYINCTSQLRVGFFGRTGTGSITNLGLTNVDVTGTYTGGLVGHCYNTVENCYTTGTVTGNGQVGGLCGLIQGSITLSNCYSTATVTVSSSGYDIGGFVGAANADISNCFSTGNVTGKSNTGGFVGRLSAGNTISNCYSKGNVIRASGATATSFGGFCGEAEEEEWKFGSAKIEYCYSIGDVTYTGASNPTDKGFCGSTTGDFFINFFDSEVSNQSSATGADAKTTAEMKTQSTFVLWNFTTIWEIIGGDGANYPTLRDNPEQSDVTTPTIQASSILFSSVQTTGMTVGWTNGDGTNRVVFAKQANTGTTSPVDNTTYTANTAFGSGTEIATGWYCVYNGTGTSVTVTNLSHSTDYIFQVFEYNGGAGEEHYLTSTATDNPKSQTTAAPPAEPTTQATNIVFSGVQGTQMTVGWTDGNGSSRVVFAKQATGGTTTPVDNTTYTANTTFGSGTEIATGWFCVYNGTGSSVTVTGLTSNTTYIFQVFEYNGGSGEENYLTATATNNPKSQTTLFSLKTTFTYTGSEQTWIVPDGVTEVSVKVWGAGGAGGTYGGVGDGGGSGGYAAANLTVTPGQELKIVVGGGGEHGIASGNGGLGGWPGGGYGTAGDASGGGGGGYCGVFFPSHVHANALIIAGGGGGGTGYYVGGAGGGTTGNQGGGPGGVGGTQSAGGSGTFGADGSALQGGNGDSRGSRTSVTSYDGGGGGGGYYGGEGGYQDARGGGGGSGFLHPTLASGNLTTGNNGLTNAGGTAPNNSDEDYIAGVGNGSNNATDAGNGLVVISYATNTLTWTGATDTDWNNATNWSTGTVPTTGAHVIIPNEANDPVIFSGIGASCNNLTVEAGASLTINSGGSLITDGTITNSGTIHIKRNITSGVWHLISNPITSATANIFVGNYLQNWDESSGTWSDIVETSTSLTPVKGYSLWTIDGTPADYTFTGTPNTGNQSLAITYTEVSGKEFDGANLLGNPYPSSIDWSGLDNTYGAVNYWNGTAYVSWNDGSGSGSQYIPPMQGFFIVTDTDGTFSVENANRTHTGATNYYKSQTDLSAGLVLFADNGSYRDDLWLLQRENRHAGFDLETDAYKFMSSTPGISQLWSVCPDGNLSIDARPYQETIQLGFTNDEPGFYSIGISQLADITTAILEDTKENIFHDLTKGDYEFAWDLADDEGRFVLHLGVTGIEQTAQPENILIYANGKNLYLKPLQGSTTGTLRLTDISGHTLMQQEMQIEGMTTVPMNVKPGVYVVSFTSNVQSAVKKVVIQ